MRRLALSTTALCATLSLAQTTALHAQDDAVDLGTLVLTGSLSPVPADRTGATVTVLDSADLTRDTALTRSLARQPGVSASANGGLGANATLRIRGLDTSYIGVRFDGIDVSDPSSTQTAFNFGGLTGTGLSRAEILKGSQSALYGSEAIAGVVDLTSWRPQGEGASAELSLEGGSFDTLIGSASAGATSERGEVAFTLGRVATEGISARAGDDETDAFAATTATAHGRFEATETLTLGLNGFRRVADIEIDRSSLDNSGEISSLQTGWRALADLETGPVRHSFAYSAFDSLREDPGGFTTRFEGRRGALDYLARVDLGAALDLDLGLSRTVEEIETSAIAASDEINIAAFGEARWQATDATTLSLALRRDDNSDFGAATTGRLALAHALGENVILRAVAGTGYRAPSLFERFSAFGDPDLEPETSVSYELGVEAGLGGRGTARATLFHTEIDELIRFDGAATACGSGFGCYGQVPGQTVTRGLELSGGYDVTDTVTVTGAYTNTDADGPDGRLARVPRHDLVLGVEARFAGRWSATAGVQRVADIEPSAFAPEDNKVDDHTLVDLGLAWQAWDGGEAFVRVENALDEAYETAGGFNTPGRAVYVGLRASF